MGYWVSESGAGRGLASAAVADVVGVGFGELGGDAIAQHAVATVLTRNGFRPFAISEAYLKIAGRWQDHILFNCSTRTGPP